MAAVLDDFPVLPPVSDEDVELAVCAVVVHVAGVSEARVTALAKAGNPGASPWA